MKLTTHTHKHTDIDKITCKRFLLFFNRRIKCTQFIISNACNNNNNNNNNEIRMI